MKEIELTQGKYALVDDADYEWVNQYKWYAQNTRGKWYAQRAIRNPSPPPIQLNVSMHRFILDAPKGVLVDHQNDNGIDNQRHNIRLATYTQNNRNKHKFSSNTSGYKGVTWHKRDRVWQVSIGLDSKLLFIGTFHNLIEAAKAYDTQARELFGEFARLNFP